LRIRERVNDWSGGSPLDRWRAAAYIAAMITLDPSFLVRRRRITAARV
jgi:hypothetical protein